MLKRCLWAAKKYMALIFLHNFPQTSHDMFLILNLYLCSLQTCSLFFFCMCLSVTLSLGIKDARHFPPQHPPVFTTQRAAMHDKNGTCFFCSVPALSTSEPLHVYFIFIYLKKKKKRGSILLHECQSRSGKKNTFLILKCIVFSPLWLSKHCQHTKTPKQGPFISVVL